MFGLGEDNRRSVTTAMEATTKTRAGYRPIKPGFCTRCRETEATEQGALCAACWEFIKEFFATKYPVMAEHDRERIAISYFKREG